MKVKLKNIIPNPFRMFDEYVPKRETVELLKESISSTFFWENVIGRKVNGKIEIAYGHHRLVALRELYPKGEKEFDIPTHHLSDVDMIQIMAAENETGNNLEPNHINLMVSQAKKFLEEHSEIRKKYRDEQFTNSDRPQGRLVGRVAISRFLGWPERRVGTSLRSSCSPQGFIVGWFSSRYTRTRNSDPG